MVEVLSIVLGVLLALGLSEWADDREHQALADAALQNVLNEVRSNHEVLTFIHENNTATIEAMKTDPDSESTQDRNFIPGLQLRETAWEALLSTGLSGYVDYDTIFMLSEMYAIQEVYKQTGVQLSEAAMNMAGYAAVNEKDIDNRHFQKQFIGYFELLADVEAGLLESFDETATRLENGN